MRINEKISIHRRDLNTRINSLKDWKISSEDKKMLLKFLDELELGKVNKGNKIGKARQLKYLDMLKISLEYFKKPTSKLIVKDIENFERDLTSNKLKSKVRDKNFAISTKVGIKLALRTYLKWKLKKKADKLVDWLDMKIPKTTPDYLSEQEIIKLFKKCKNSIERYLVSLLFDGGCRAEEFMNIRYEDIQLPKDKDNFVKITLKEEYSKTKGRVISLYWKNSLESIKDFLEEREQEGIRSNEPVYNKTYDALRLFLRRFGKKVLNKNIYPHLFRHSSATYYANKLNRQELCYRYGWKFSSEMPDIYISRSGMENKQLDEKFTSTELEDLKRELNNQKQHSKLELDNLKSSIAGYFKITAKRNAKLNVLMSIYLSEDVSNKERKEALVKLKKHFTPESVYNIE